MNERHLVMREVTTGYYQALPYLLAKCETYVAASCVPSTFFVVCSLHPPSVLPFIYEGPKRTLGAAGTCDAVFLRIIPAILFAIPFYPMVK